MSNNLLELIPTVDDFISYAEYLVKCVDINTNTVLYSEF